MKINRKYLNWALVVIWMIVIFCFSSKPGDVSDKDSKFVLYIFNLLGLNLHSVFKDMANFAVRKTAHFSEYIILYILLYRAIKSTAVNISKIPLLSILGVFLYASSDEFHQLFVPGRTGKITDVMIDCSGSLIITILIYITAYLKKRKLKARE